MPLRIASIIAGPVLAFVIYALMGNSNLDHAPRAVLTAIAAGLDAAVPEGIRLPADYDPESGQPWTRSREAFVPVDLMARAFTA